MINNSNKYYIIVRIGCSRKNITVPSTTGTRCFSNSSNIDPKIYDGYRNINRLKDQQDTNTSTNNNTKEDQHKYYHYKVRYKSV